MSEVFSTPIQYIKGVGPKLAKVLEKKGIKNYEDALYFLPREYEDRSRLSPIASLTLGKYATVYGEITSNRKIGRGRRSRFEAILKDDTGSLHLNWFHGSPYLEEEFKVGSFFVVTGQVKFFNGMPQITHPEYERVEGGEPKKTFNFGRIVPVYSETQGLHQKTIRRIMGEVLKAMLPHLNESLPESLLLAHSLPTLRKSFVELHFPENLKLLKKNQDRLVFEEFFVLQLGLLLKKRNRERFFSPILIDEKKHLSTYIKNLPFPLTDDQNIAIASLIRDLGKKEFTTRLIQGDVGSRKTVVAFATAVISQSAGFQSAMMAPTELLAQQHFNTAEKFLSGLGIKIELLTHSTSSKKEVRDRIQSGKVDFVIGTHALFQEKIEFSKLGVVIVDEQHRFGVDQRTELLRKGKEGIPHMVLMTATPIPRTLALTLYGDLDLTLIKQKPIGRKPILTKIVREKDRPKLYQKIREKVKNGEQVYVIYPLVEESEKLELKSATEMHLKLQKEIFPELKVLLLHGRMKSDEKDKILVDFKAKKADILVSTTVIEVGIDVPNATLMVIEHPERLGLSQLHQLRGRVGRGEKPSECLLVADKFVTERLRIMEQTEDGFVIAEEDLKIRGPGEFLGTRQSGLPGFRIGDVLRDADLLVAAKDEAEKILSKDHNLELPENKLLKDMVEFRWKEKLERLRGA